MRKYLVALVLMSAWAPPAEEDPMPADMEDVPGNGRGVGLPVDPQLPTSFDELADLVTFIL